MKIYLFCLIIGLVSLPNCILAEEIEPIPGDLNLDGTVDFADFVIFAQNFGKTVPPPEEVKWAAMAKELLGFWRFDGQDRQYYFIIGETRLPSREMADIVPLAYGITNKGGSALAGYTPGIEKYTILYRPSETSTVYVAIFFELVFDDNQIRPFGTIVHIESDGDIILNSEFIEGSSIRGIDVLMDENGFLLGKDWLPRVDASSIQTEQELFRIEMLQML